MSKISSLLGGGQKAPKDTSAETARAEEDARQARILEGRKAIDRIFDGTTVGNTRATSYVPGMTYYNEDGSVFTPPAPAAVTAPAQASAAPATMVNSAPAAPASVAPAVDAATTAKIAALRAMKGQQSEAVDASIDRQIAALQPKAAAAPAVDAATAAKISALNAMKGQQSSSVDASIDRQVAALQAQAAPAAPAVTPESIASVFQQAITGGNLFTDTKQTGGYQDAYYDDYAKKIQDYYNPQVDKDYEDARKTMTFQLARTGNLESQAAANRYGELETTRNNARTDVANKALTGKQTLRQNVENQRSTLYDLNSSAADPSLVASRAAAASANLNATPELSPIGNAFAGLINQGSGLVSLASQGYNGFNLPVPSYGSSSRGSGRVVN